MFSSPEAPSINSTTSPAVPVEVSRGLFESTQTDNAIRNSKAQSQCHGIKNIHSGILAHPGAAFGRQTETEFFWKPLDDNFGKGVFFSSVIAKKDRGTKHPPAQ